MYCITAETKLSLYELDGPVGDTDPQTVEETMSVQVKVKYWKAGVCACQLLQQGNQKLGVQL